jgi:RNA polymerase sigma factor (sigma-70 family)
MSRLEEEFSDFVVQQYPLLLKFLLGHKLMVFDAEDVAQTVFTEVLARWAQVRDPRSYLYRIAKNEVAARARRQFRDVDKAQRLMGGRVECLAAEDVYHQRDVGLVRDSLVVLPPRQREVMVRIYQGYRISDIAAEIGISTATVRSNLRHGRNTLRPLLNGDRQGLHRRAGLQLYEAYQRGDPLPVSPRPLIRWAWDMAKAAKVNPERGNAVRLSGDDDEVKRRRQESPLAACSWARDMLTELGKATGQMMVVVDADGVVLWRDGDRGVLKRAERLGFSEGAYWDIQHAGANGIALALMTGRTVTVCGWEHFVQSQHHLSCVAAPVRGPLDGQALCVLNLTGTRPTIHHAILHEIDTIAMRLHRQLRTSWIPHS